MSSYTTSYDVKMLAQVSFKQLEFSTDGDYEAFIDNVLVPQAQKIIDNHCNHDFNNHIGGTVTLDGTGKDHVIVKPEYCPLRSLSSVSIDGVAKTVGDFKVYPQYVAYDDGTFTQDEQNVVLVADYGYTSVPTDVEFVCASISANMLQYMLKSKLMPDFVLPSLEAGRLAATLMSSPQIFTAEHKAMLGKYTFIQIEVG